MCAPYLEKSKATFLLWFIKRSSIHVTATLSNLTDFNNFCTAETEKMYETRHAFLKNLLLKESVANDAINVSLFAGPVCYEPCHRRRGGVVYRPVSTLKADILNITYDCYSQNNNVEMAAL